MGLSNQLSSLPTVVPNTFARPNSNDPLSESLSRSLAQATLIDFITYTYPKYNPEPFHVKVSEILEHVVSGGIKRLMIFAPPQHGKSEIVSVRLPPFWLSKRPDDPVIIASYGAALAGTKAGAARILLHSKPFYNLFPSFFIEERKKGKLTPKSPYSTIMGVGVGGAITGFGAGLGIIDDPVKNYEDGMNPNNRDRIWKWWQGTFRTRVWERGAIVIIMTRWHEDDLAGRILNTSGEKWDVVRFPAIAENQEERDEFNKRYLPKQLGFPDPLNRIGGQPLSPGRYSLHELESLKHDVGTMAWYAEYQGTPRPIEGNRIKREWLIIADETPRKSRMRIRYWDKAGTSGGGAYTAGLLMSYGYDGIFYIENMVRGQWSALEREQIIKETAELDRDIYGEVEIWIEQEPGSGGVESAELTVKNLAGFRIRVDRASKSKDIRLEPFAVQAEAKNIRLKKGKWNWDYIEELTLFPSSGFKDQVDATSGAFNKLVVIKDNKKKTYRGSI